MKEKNKIAEIEIVPENREGTGSVPKVGPGRPPVEFRFKKGRSGNPGGRPKTKPFTDRIRALMETSFPPSMREPIEKALGIKLDANFSFGDAFILNMMVEGITGRRLDIFLGMKLAVDGPDTQHVEVTDATPQDPQTLKLAVAARLFDVAQKRARMFDMPLPALTSMAEEAGVKLDIPREDEPRNDGEPK